MTWIANNLALAALAAAFAGPAIYGIACSIRAELQDRARDRQAYRLGGEVESVPVHGLENDR